MVWCGCLGHSIENEVSRLDTGEECVNTYGNDFDSVISKDTNAGIRSAEIDPDSWSTHRDGSCLFVTNDNVSQRSVNLKFLCLFWIRK